MSLERRVKVTFLVLALIFLFIVYVLPVDALNVDTVYGGF